MADADADLTDRRLTSSPSSLSASSLSSFSRSSDELAEEMAIAFSKYTNFTVDKEEAKFNESVEMMLTKLDEFFSLVDMVRSDTRLCLATTLPEILTKCAEMEAIFHKIDKLEEFVNMVRDNVAVVEDKVTKAEADLSSMGGLVKKLTSFVSLKKTPPKAAVYTRPKVFKTSDFFDQPDEEKSANASNASLNEEKQASLNQQSSNIS